MAKAILLVDDEEMIREVVQEKLSRSAEVFYHANNGVEALRLLQAHSDIAVVISDMKMPVMDGAQFIKEARTQGFKQPFIIFTAYATGETLNEVRTHGVHAFIEKGQTEGLLEALASCLQSPRALVNGVQ